MLDLYRAISHQDAEETDEDLGQVNPAYKYLDQSNQQNQFGSLEKSDLFDHNQADMIMSFVDKEHQMEKDGSKGDIYDSYLDHLTFDASDVQPQVKLIGAELRLYSNGSLPSNYFSEKRGTLKVYLPLTAETVRMTPKGDKGWLVLNVTEALEHWILYPKKNSGLLAEIVEESTGRKRSPHRDFGLKHGFVVGFFNAGNEEAHRRVRRSATSPNDRDWRRKKRNVHPLSEYYDEHISRRVCQKRTLYVSFRDLGWEGWIIAPDGFAAYYCQGECSFPLQAAMNATNHAIVQTLVNLMDPLRDGHP